MGIARIKPEERGGAVRSSRRIEEILSEKGLQIKVGIDHNVTATRFGTGDIIQQVCERSIISYRLLMA
jgi:hypothetical protein